MTTVVDAGPRLVHAASLRSALDALGEPGAVAVGGGVGLTLRRHSSGGSGPSPLVAVGTVPELGGIESTESGVRIGAAETLHTVATDLVVGATWPAVAEACGSVATERIRRCVTLGGNIAPADPAHDPPVALAAAGARLTVAGSERERSIPVAELPVSAGELVTSVVLPAPVEGTGSAFLKYLVRGVWEYACVAVAAVVRADEAGRIATLRVALGSVAPTTLLVHADDLVGSSYGDDVVAEVAERARTACEPVSDVRGSAAYKREMAATYVHRAMRLAFERAGA